jgi:hypothetical protein
VKVLLQVLFYAAGHLCSVFAACSQLRTAPSDQAVRDALTALCPDPVFLEQRLNRLFAAQQTSKAGGLSLCARRGKFTGSPADSIENKTLHMELCISL